MPEPMPPVRPMQAGEGGNVCCLVLGRRRVVAGRLGSSLGSRLGRCLVGDFRGLSPKSFDGRGNFAMGIKEHLVFPEIDYDKADSQLGMDVIVCTTAKTDDEARALLRAFNFPFRQ